jgi:hypothetical protein
MVIQQKEIRSFFKRKQDELNIENEATVGEEQSPTATDCAPLIETEVEHHGQEQEQEQAQPFEHHSTLHHRQPMQPVMFRGIEFLERDPTLRP